MEFIDPIVELQSTMMRVVKYTIVLLSNLLSSCKQQLSLSRPVCMTQVARLGLRYGFTPTESGDIIIF